MATHFQVVDRQTGTRALLYDAARTSADRAFLASVTDLDGWALTEDGFLLVLDSCGRYAFVDQERFSVEMLPTESVAPFDV